MYIIECAMCNIHCRLYIAHIVYITYYTLYNVNCTSYKLYYTLCVVCCTIQTLPTFVTFVVCIALQSSCFGACAKPEIFAVVYIRFFKPL